MSLHLKTVLTSGRKINMPVFIFGVNVCHLGNTEVTAVTCKASPEVGDKTQNPTTHHKKRKTDSQRSRRHKSKCVLRAITMASERRLKASSRAFYLSTRALVILDLGPTGMRVGRDSGLSTALDQAPKGQRGSAGCSTREPPLSSAIGLAEA